MTVKYVRQPYGRLRIRGTITERELFSVAEEVIASNFVRSDMMSDPQAAMMMFKVRLATCPNEVFCCAYLDTRHRILAVEDMFHGTIDGCEVHPRVIAKRTLELSAAAVPVAHQHPSGIAEPSTSDRAIPQRLRTKLDLIDVRLLVHFVVGGNTAVSFRASGWL